MVSSERSYAIFVSTGNGPGTNPGRSLSSIMKTSVERERHDPRGRALYRHGDLAGRGAGAACCRNVDAVKDRSGVLGVVEIPSVERDAGRDLPRVRLRHGHRGD